MTQPSAPEPSTPQSHPAEWLTDSNGQLALSIRYKDKPLFQEQSPYQTVEVFDTYSCGKMLTIDSMVMCTEWDEAAYHEMIAQVPMLTHPCWASGFSVQRCSRSGVAGWQKSA